MVVITDLSPCDLHSATSQVKQLMMNLWELSAPRNVGFVSTKPCKCMLRSPRGGCIH